MKVISHRGNLIGSVPDLENRPGYIEKALEAGFDVEIDVWMERGAWKLGHDYPEHDTTMEFISQKGLFLHAKNLEALVALLSTDLHYFWHDVDHYTLTSKNFIWTFPQMKTTRRSIIVCQDEHQTNTYKNMPIAGICTDYAFLGEDK